MFCIVCVECTSMCDFSDASVPMCRLFLSMFLHVFGFLISIRFMRTFLCINFDICLLFGSSSRFYITLQKWKKKTKENKRRQLRIRICSIIPNFFQIFDFVSPSSPPPLPPQLQQQQPVQAPTTTSTTTTRTSSTASIATMAAINTVSTRHHQPNNAKI